MVKNLVITLIVVALLIGGIFYYNKNKEVVVNNNDTSSPSIEGCYIVKKSSDVYTLQIDSQNGEQVSGTLKYKNYQKDSSSGTFVGTFKDNILVGIYSFQSEGMDSKRQVAFKKDGDSFIQGFGPVTVVDDTESFQDLSQVTYDPTINSFNKSITCDETIVYKDSAGTFSFIHDADFPAIEGDKTPTKEWAQNSTRNGVLLAYALIPKLYMPNTNFSEAKLTIGRSADTQAIASCEVAANGMTKDTDKVNIDGFSFSKMYLNEAAAGNLYDTTSYRGILDGDCYVIEYTIHSTNIANYPESAGIKEFDKSKVVAELEKIISTIKFDLASD